MTKDKSKQFRISMDDVLGSVQTLCDVSNDCYSDNIKEIMSKIETSITSGTDVAELDNFEIEIDIEELDEEKLINSSLSKYREEIGDAIADFFNDAAIPHLQNCNADMWLEIADEYKEASQSQLRLAYIIDKVFTVLSEARCGKMLPSYYTIVRDGIYTWAELLDIEEEDVIGLAILSTIYKVGIDKKGDYALYSANIKGNVKVYMLEKVFGDILTARVIGDEIDGYRTMLYDISLKEISNVYVDICNDEEYTVVDGIAYDKDDNRVFDMYNKDFNGTVITLCDRLLEKVDIYKELGIRNNVPMLITDENIVREGRKFKQTDKNNNLRTIKEMSTDGDFALRNSKNGKVMVTKDNKDILCTIDPSVAPVFEGIDPIDNLFFLGHDSSEAWNIDGKTKDKKGIMVIFDVDPDEYFDENDIEFINNFLKVEDRQEQANKDLGVTDDDDKYETSF